jgi:alkaline phosphatase
MVLSDNEIAKLEAALAKQMLLSSERNYTADEQIMYGTYQPLSVTLTHILNNKAGMTFSSYSHTALPVPVYAYGLGQELFDGYYDNTDINHKLAAILGLN